MIDLHSTQPFTTLNGLAASPTSRSWIVILLITIVGAYFIQRTLEYINVPILSLPEIVWNAFVYVMPSPVVLGLKSQYLGRNDSLGVGTSSNRHAAKSEILRNAFGLGTSGLLGRASSYPNAPKGLGNWDNSCYQNSILQALASLPALQDFFAQTNHELRGLPDSSTLSTLSCLIRNVNDTSKNTKYLWTPARLKSMSSWQQQDAQEYFSKLAEALEKDLVSGIKEKDLEKARVRLSKLLIQDEPPVEVTPASDQLDGSSKEEPQPHVKESNGTEWLREQMLQNPLEGLLAQRVGCTQCGFTEGLSLLPFNCMTLPLGRKDSYSIEDCLNESTELEYIEGVECAKCTLIKMKQRLQAILEAFSETQLDREEADSVTGRTGSRVAAPMAFAAQRLTAVDEALQDEEFSDTTLTGKCQIPKAFRVASTKTRQAVVMRAPQCLVLHVNRSLFDDFTGNQLKNYTLLRYPKRFDLSLWSLGSNVSSESNDSQSACKAWEMGPSKTMIPRAGGTSSHHALPYELRAVVTHYGRHENGHYICYRRLLALDSLSNLDTDGGDASDHVKNSSKDEDTWWRLSDETVTPVSEDDVLAQGGAFMLFYERIDQASPPAGEDRLPEGVGHPAFAANGTAEAQPEKSSEEVASASQQEAETEEEAKSVAPVESSPHITPGGTSLSIDEDTPPQSSINSAGVDEATKETSESPSNDSSAHDQPDTAWYTTPSQTFAPPPMRTAGPTTHAPEDEPFKPSRMVEITW